MDFRLAARKKGTNGDNWSEDQENVVQPIVWRYAAHAVIDDGAYRVDAAVPCKFGELKGVKVDVEPGWTEVVKALQTEIGSREMELNVPVSKAFNPQKGLPNAGTNTKAEKSQQAGRGRLPGWDKPFATSFHHSTQQHAQLKLSPKPKKTPKPRKTPLACPAMRNPNPNPAWAQQTGYAPVRHPSPDRYRQFSKEKIQQERQSFGQPSPASFQSAQQSGGQSPQYGQSPVQQSQQLSGQPRHLDQLAGQQLQQPSGQPYHFGRLPVDQFHGGQLFNPCQPPTQRFQQSSGHIHHPGQSSSVQHFQQPGQQFPHPDQYSPYYQVQQQQQYGQP